MKILLLLLLPLNIIAQCVNISLDVVLDVPYQEYYGSYAVSKTDSMVRESVKHLENFDFTINIKALNNTEDQIVFGTSKSLNQMISDYSTFMSADITLILTNRGLIGGQSGLSSSSELCNNRNICAVKNTLNDPYNIHVIAHEITHSMGVPFHEQQGECLMSPVAVSPAIKLCEHTRNQLNNLHTYYLTCKQHCPDLPLGIEHIEIDIVDCRHEVVEVTLYNQEEITSIVQEVFDGVMRVTVNNRYKKYVLIEDLDCVVLISPNNTLEILGNYKKLHIFDINGMIRSVDNLTPGLYYVRIEVSDNYFETKMFVKI